MNKVEKVVDRLVKIKIIRPFVLTIAGACLLTWITVAYVFDLEM